MKFDIVSDIVRREIITEEEGSSKIQSKIITFEVLVRDPRNNEEFLLTLKRTFRPAFANPVVTNGAVSGDLKKRYGLPQELHPDTVAIFLSQIVGLHVDAQLAKNAPLEAARQKLINEQAELRRQQTQQVKLNNATKVVEIPTASASGSSLYLQ